MSPHTARYIKMILSQMGNLYGTCEGVVYIKARERDELEKLLGEFAESIKDDTLAAVNPKSGGR